MLAKPIITRGRFAIDGRGLGYLTSMVSGLFLGAVAWPKAVEPDWHAQREIKEAEAKATRR